MRELIVSNIVSLDGYAAGPGGDVMALPMDHAFDQHNAELVGAADGLVLGATTYRGFLGFWPHALEMPELTPASAEVARRYAAGLPIVVISDELTEADTGPWREQTRITSRAAAPEVIAELKRGGDGPLVTFGSMTAAGGLLAAGVVDELRVMISPRLLGDGVPAFPGGVPADLARVDVRTWEGSPNLLVRYRL